MRRLASVMVIGAALTTAASAQRLASAPQASLPALAATLPAPAATLSATQALFDRWVAARRLPGIAGAFGQGDAPTVFVSAGRIAAAPGAPAATPDSLWRIYSMTKPVTGIAAMMLVEEGRIGLDDPLSKYFPAFAAMRVLKNPDTSLDSVPATRPITIRMLLTHSAGLSYNIIAKGPLLKEYERLGLVPATVNAGVEAQARAVRPRTLAEFANRVAEAPLIAQPGTRWSYSIGLDVMGAVIEKASGMPFDAFVQARILDPLGMTSTYWQVPPGAARRLADNVLVGPAGFVPVDPAATSPWLSAPSFPYGGAGLVSSARDYDRFLHMLQNRGTLGPVRILRPETAMLAMSDLLPPGVRFSGHQPGTMANAGFGAGGMVAYMGADRQGARVYGWSGAANSVAWVDPVRRFRASVMVNVFPPGALPVREEVMRTLAADTARGVR